MNARSNITGERFSRTDTNICKGGGIILMLVHHLFYTSPTLCEQYEVVNFYLPMSFTMLIGELGKVCVSVFVFLTGFGITRSYMTAEVLDHKAIRINTSKRFARLEANFVFVYIIALVGALISGNIADKYTVENIFGEKIFYSLIDMFGFQSLFGTPTLNATWWYMTIALLYILIMPILFSLHRKYGGIVWILCTLLPYVFKIDTLSFFRYLSALSLGIYCSYNNVLEKIKSLKINGAAKLLLYLVMIGGLSLIRLQFGYYNLTETLLAVLLICFSCEFISKIGIINKAFNFLGVHSMNIFLIHTFVFQQYLSDQIYSLKYASLILIVTLLLSCIASFTIEELKDFMRFRVLVKKVCDRIENTID